MLINLEPWEINLILSALAEQPYNTVAGTIQRLKEQYENNSNHSGHSSDPDSANSEAR